MQDRPTYDELLAAVERFLSQEIVPNTEGARRFHARVAPNAVLLSIIIFAWSKSTTPERVTGRRLR